MASFFLEFVAMTVRELPWIVRGDFNELLYVTEKFGGHGHSISLMDKFRDTLNQCNLQDLHALREFFTWTNMRKGVHLVFERLDRFCANHEWRTLFSSVVVENLGFFSSDHRAIQLSFNRTIFDFIPKHRFSFLAWLYEGDFLQILHEFWPANIWHTDLRLALSQL